MFVVYSVFHSLSLSHSISLRSHDLEEVLRGGPAPRRRQPGTGSCDSTRNTVEREMLGCESGGKLILLSVHPLGSSLHSSLRSSFRLAREVMAAPDFGAGGELDFLPSRSGAAELHLSPAGWKIFPDCSQRA